MKLKGREYDEDMLKLAVAICDLFPIYEGSDFSTKRPFGNSDIEGDVADIIGLEFPYDEEDDTDPYDSDEYHYCEELYRDVGKWMKKKLKAGVK